MKNSMFFGIFFILLLLNSVFLSIEARPINAVEVENYINEEITTKIGDLYIEAIKTGGPSDAGKGHKFTEGHSLQGIKNSGPSPGEGH